MAFERLGAKGELLPTSAPPAFGSASPTGLIVYDASGYMGITIMQSGRQRFTGAQPTPDEAKAALLSYGSYCGTFSVDASNGTVTHHVQASLDPNNTGTDQKSGFEFSGDRLILKTTQGVNGIQSRMAWERVPDVVALTPTHRRLIGFWKHVSTERRGLDAKLVRTEPRRDGFLIFTRAGHMSVCVMNPGRKKYAAAEPTPEEAQSALSTYGSYFGRYEVNDKESYEVTRQAGGTNPTQAGQLAVRFLGFVGNNRFIEKPPPAILDGQLVQGYLTWERVTPPVRSTQ